MNLKQSFLSAIKSRTFVMLWIVILLQTIALVVLAVVNTRSGLTVQTHCDLGSSVPDCTHAEAPWWYTLNFAGFAVSAFVLNLLVSLKILDAKGRPLAIAWLWLAIIILLVATILIFAILRIVEL